MKLWTCLTRSMANSNVQLTWGRRKNSVLGYGNWSEMEVRSWQNGKENLCHLVECWITILTMFIHRRFIHPLVCGLKGMTVDSLFPSLDLCHVSTISMTIKMFDPSFEFEFQHAVLYVFYKIKAKSSKTSVFWANLQDWLWGLGLIYVDQTKFYLKVRISGQKSEVNVGSINIEKCATALHSVEEQHTLFKQFTKATCIGNAVYQPPWNYESQIDNNHQPQIRNVILWLFNF